MKVKTRKGDRLLIWDKRGTIIHASVLGRGRVEVIPAK